MSFPSTMICPYVALSIPPIKLRRVVFPAPLAPTITTTSPFFISKETLSTASISMSPVLYLFTRFFISINSIFHFSYIKTKKDNKKILLSFVKSCLLYHLFFLFAI